MANQKLNDSEVIIQGRPDLPGGKYGITFAKNHPQYVFGKGGNASLVHRCVAIELYWYRAAFDHLVRLKKPRIIAETGCGQTFFITDKRAVLCKIPKPDALLCGRCQGNAPTFSKKYGQAVPDRKIAKQHLGCIL